MEPNKILFQAIKTDEVKSRTIIHNFLVMLSNRIYIDANGNKQPLIGSQKDFEKIEDRGDNTYTIRANNGDDYAIKIVFQRISATGKQSIISEFFKDYTKYKKIIVARDFNNKISDYVTKHHTQIFRESMMLYNIIDYRDQPRFELLTPAEMEQVKNEYNITSYTTKKMLRSDPIAKYYALRKDDIIRIIRPSFTSGEAIDYRIVT